MCPLGRRAFLSRRGPRGLCATRVGSEAHRFGPRCEEATVATVERRASGSREGRSQGRRHAELCGAAHALLNNHLFSFVFSALFVTQCSAGL